MTGSDPKEPASANLPLFRGKVRLNSFDRQLVDVVTKVKSGRMTPGEAEAWAKEHGYSPFVFRPSDKVSNKTLKERYWPFALAMAWSPTREPAAAMHAWNSYMTWGAGRERGRMQIDHAGADRPDSTRSGIQVAGDYYRKRPFSTRSALSC